jgi:DNA-binding NarL/FixJ family response regulator
MAFPALVYEFPAAAPLRAARDRRRRQSRRGETTPAGHALTPRQREVCDLVSAAWANKEIAVALGLSEQTVKNYLRGAFEKLGVTTRLELMRYWLQHGREHGAASTEVTGAASTATTGVERRAA